THSPLVVNVANNQSVSVTDHRNVIFGTDVVPPMPLDSLDYPSPPKLWEALDTACTEASGCDVVTIPHNTNISAGVSLVVFDSSPAGVARQRKYQVAVEMYQHKGGSECYYSPAEGYDEAACQFEYLDGEGEQVVNPSPANFVRTALGTGIGFSAEHPESGNPL